MNINAIRYIADSIKNNVNNYRIKDKSIMQLVSDVNVVSTIRSFKMDPDFMYYLAILIDNNPIDLKQVLSSESLSLMLERSFVKILMTYESDKAYHVENNMLMRLIFDDEDIMNRIYDDSASTNELDSKMGSKMGNKIVSASLAMTVYGDLVLAKEMYDMI